jgi:hypothetical protein
MEAIDVTALQRSSGEQTAEAAAHDHDAMAALCRSVACRACRSFDVPHALPLSAHRPH